MKKKIIFVCCVLVGLFILLHFWKFGAYYFSTLGNEKYVHNDFTGALLEFKKSQTLNDSFETIYNQGTTEYKKGNYLDAKSLLTKVSTGALDNTLKYKAFHNLGNTLYQLGTQEPSLEKMKELYTQSIQSYNDALSLQQDIETQKNKEFVEKKLKELEEKKDQQSQSESGTSQQEKTGSGSTGEHKGMGTQEAQGGSNNASSQNENGSQQSQTQSGSRDEKYKLNEDSGVGNLSEEEKETIENRQKKLEKFQKQNQGSFGVEQSQKQDFMDLFESNPFFRNDIGGSQKDW